MTGRPKVSLIPVGVAVEAAIVRAIAESLRTGRKRRAVTASDRRARAKQIQRRRAKKGYR